MSRLRLAFAIVSIAAYWLMVCLPLTVLGFIVVPVAVPFRSLGLSPIDGRVIERLPAWAWLWSNDQEGCLPKWYREYRAKWPEWLARLEWLTWRNSGNNLRFVRWLNPSYTHPVQYHEMHAGAYTLFWRSWRYRLIKRLSSGKTLLAGWKWDPNPQPWQAFGVGFGIRLKGPDTPLGDWRG